MDGVKEIRPDWTPDEDTLRVVLTPKSGEVNWDAVTLTNHTSPEAEAIRDVGYNLISWLIQKNEQYGSSAFDPVRIFSKADVLEQIKVRLDDKVSRLARGNDSMETDDDVIRDLAGYLIIYLAAKELQEKGDE